MSDYLLANRDKISAMIGLGDLVTGSSRASGTRSACPPARSPSWAGATRPTTAQEIIDGYVLAGMWQDPQMTSYLGLSLAQPRRPAASRPGFDILVGALYEADTAPTYLDLAAEPLDLATGRPGRSR